MLGTVAGNLPYVSFSSSVNAVFKIHKMLSAGHMQVQEFIVVIDPITKRKLCEASLGQHWIKKAPILIVVCSNPSRSVKRYEKRGTEFIALSMVHYLDYNVNFMLCLR